MVGNPPYITASDKALNVLYRERYTRTCYRQFSLGVPFTERFFQLALHNGDAPAGYVGMITADSFMKREFGKKLIEEFLPQQDLTHVIHTSGAYIPGHGTPTVILFGRNRRPVAETLRAVLGIRGEPGTPADPATGLVWSSIVDLTDQPGRSNDYISVSDMKRERLAAHPWSLQGGSTPEILDQLDSCPQILANASESIGFHCITKQDEAFSQPAHVLRKAAIEPTHVREFGIGEEVRDWCVVAGNYVIYPYDATVTTIPPSEIPCAIQFLWPYRATLYDRKVFTGENYRQAGKPWYEYGQIPASKQKTPLTIAFAEITSHNHFVLDRAGKIFNQTAPVIKLPEEATGDDHLALLGLLNSSTCDFWMRQRCFNKGMGDEPFADRIQRAGSQVEQFPLPFSRPLALTRKLDRLAQLRSLALPAGLESQYPMSRAELNIVHGRADSLLAQMIASQEELDWWCYHAYGLLDEALCLDGTPPEIQLGERAFEIVLARHIAGGTSDTTWFARHGSTPITELPAHWPADYRALVQRRIDLIESNDWIGLLERPEYKRRWNQPGWDELEQAALKSWLLDRLETPAYWPEFALQRSTELAARAERDADFMAVAALYTGHPAFDVPALILALLGDESMPALRVLRYKESGLRKRSDWEQTWDKQRQEDAIDAVVAAEHPRHADESEQERQARIKPLQDRRKTSEIGNLPAPPKYASADFLHTTLWRLRGGLDVPKERFFTVPDPQAPSTWLYGWAGWNPAQRARAVAGAYAHTEQSSGADAIHLLPLLAAVHEDLPWILQWHNAVDPELDARLGDFFKSWLGEQLNRQGWTLKTLNEWRPAAVSGRRRRAS